MKIYLVAREENLIFLIMTCLKRKCISVRSWKKFGSWDKIYETKLLNVFNVWCVCPVWTGLVDHDLTRHARALQTVKPENTQGLHQHTHPLENYYLKTRYPNRCPKDTIPSDNFHSDDADKAKVHAKGILDVVKSIVWWTDTIKLSPYNFTVKHTGTIMCCN